MVKAAETTFGEVDAVLMLTEPLGRMLLEDENIVVSLKMIKHRLYLLINKTDCFEEEKILNY